MKRLICSNKDGVLTTTILNLCSLQFDSVKNNLHLISSEINLQSDIVRTHISNKSISFVYKEEIVYGPAKPDTEKLIGGFGKFYSEFMNTFPGKEDDLQTTYHVTIHKSFLNSYAIKQSRTTVTKGVIRDSIVITLPSKMFKELRYNYYHNDRIHLKNYLETVLNFKYRKQMFSICFDQGKTVLKEFTYGKVPNQPYPVVVATVNLGEITEYVSKKGYLLFNVNHLTFNLFPNFGHSKKMGNNYYCNFQKDFSRILDIWDYFKQYPLTVEELKTSSVGIAVTDDFDFDL